MPGKQYFLTATLPFLRFDRGCPLGKQDFLEQCQRWLSDKEIEYIKTADIYDPQAKEGDPEIIKQWKAFDKDIKETIKEARQNNMQVAKKQITTAMKNALEKKDPLLREKALEEIRWRFLEGEEYKHVFSINGLVLYFLKVQILERLNSFDKEKGKERFKQACEVKNEQKEG